MTKSSEVFVFVAVSRRDGRRRGRRQCQASQRDENTPGNEALS